jgi:D-sedoheptulose 7-phosphate isomerase
LARSLQKRAELRLRLLEFDMENLVRAVEMAAFCLRRGSKLMFFGNGGSAADAQHIAAEFVCRFQRSREPLAALSLVTDTSVLTAIGNDYGFEQIFARQVVGLGAPNDMAVAISTSGRSPNVLAGVRAARLRGLRTIALTGGDGGGLAKLVNIAIIVPSKDTALIQECHIAWAHLLCEGVELLRETNTRARGGAKTR